MADHDDVPVRLIDGPTPAIEAVAATTARTFGSLRGVLSRAEGTLRQKLGAEVDEVLLTGKALEGFALTKPVEGASLVLRIPLRTPGGHLVETLERRYGLAIFPGTGEDIEIHANVNYGDRTYPLTLSYPRELLQGELVDEHPGITLEPRERVVEELDIERGDEGQIKSVVKTSY